MSFFKKLFGKKEKPQQEEVVLPWLEAAKSPWGVRLLDLRPYMHQMISTTTERRLAENAASYMSDDGLSFVGIQPPEQETIEADISFKLDQPLLPGVLFIPAMMEHKWAIYYHGDKIIFVRSWLRKVWVIADTVQENGQLRVTSITGKFLESEPPELTRRLLKAILATHAMRETVPVPLPSELIEEPLEAAQWAFSVLGNLADCGVFEDDFDYELTRPLRSSSLMHIAVARGDLHEVRKFIQQGIDINTLAADGMSAVHWSNAPQGTEAMSTLLELGADPNVRSAEGATPLMNAVQSNKAAHAGVLLKAGADVNAKDLRGFTSLHRAAEMGHVDMVKLLLAAGADKAIAAGGYTALSLAEHRGNRAIMKLLRG